MGEQQKVEQVIENKEEKLSEKESQDITNDKREDGKTTRRSKLMEKMASVEAEELVCESKIEATEYEVLLEPTNIRLINKTRDQIEIGWTPPRHQCEVGDIGFMIEYRQQQQSKKQEEVEEAEWLIANYQPVRFTSYLMTSLLPGNKYQFRVRAVNESTTSKFYERPMITSSDWMTTEDLLTEPKWEGKEIFQVSTNKFGRPWITRNSCKVDWEVPLDDGGSGIDGHQLQYRPSTGGKSSYKSVNNRPIRGDQTSFVIEGLETNMKYQLRVRSCNNQGWSKWLKMNELVHIREDIVPSPYDVIISKIGEDFVELSWKPPSFTSSAAAESDSTSSTSSVATFSSTSTSSSSKTHKKVTLNKKSTSATAAATTTATAEVASAKVEVTSASSSVSSTSSS